MATAAMADRYVPQQSWLQRMKQSVLLFYHKATNDKVFDRASGLAFQALFSIIPVLAIAYFLFALSGGFEDIRDDLEKLAVSYIAPTAGDDVLKYLHTIQEKVSPGAIGVFGVLAFLWAGISMISKAEQALNEIWGLRRTRSLKQRLLLYTGALIGAPIALGASLFMTSWLAAVTKGVGGVSDIVKFALALAPLVVSIAFFSIIYWFLPYTTISRKAAFKAGIVTAVVIEVLKQGYAFYASWSIGDSIYGSLAILPVLFLWLSFSSIVFMLGAELCYFFDSRESGVIHVARPESHLSFPLLVDILRAYQKAQGPLTVKKVVHQLNWDQSDIFRHVHFLANIGLLRSPRGAKEGDECYEATEAGFDAALEKLLNRINSVKYERLEMTLEEGISAADRVWSPWGASRKPPQPTT